MPKESARVNAPDAIVATRAERLGDDGLRFVRELNVRVDDVWAALTTSNGLAAWLGAAIAIELVPGGRFEIALGDADRMDGRIIAIEPNRRLAIEWHETSNGVGAPYGTLAGDRSTISFDLTATPDGGTMLVFVHRHIRGEQLASFGAGWHAHLDALRAALLHAPPVDRDARYAELRPHYDAVAGFHAEARGS